jgi:hypothetical protein
MPQYIGASATPGSITQTALPQGCFIGNPRAYLEQIFQHSAPGADISAERIGITKRIRFLLQHSKEFEVTWGERGISTRHIPDALLGCADQPRPIKVAVS